MPYKCFQCASQVNNYYCFNEKWTMKYREKCLVMLWSCAGCIFQDGTKRTLESTHVFLDVYNHNPCRPFSVIKRCVGLLQVVRCAPIVFNTSFASGPVARLNVFYPLINLQKQPSAALRRLTEQSILSSVCLRDLRMQLLSVFVFVSWYFLSPIVILLVRLASAVSF